MHNPLETGGRAAGDAVSALGFRRVEQVRVIVGKGQAVAEVTGVTHRYPHTFRISLASAARLAHAGVPLRMESATRRGN